MMRTIQIVAFVLWRGGLLLAGGSALFLGVRYGLKLFRFLGFTIPVAAEIGLGIGIAGFLLVAISLILERVQDARLERGEER
jgi:hypothetical protein